MSVVDKIEVCGKRAYRAVGPMGNGLAIVCESEKQPGQWLAYILMQDGRCLGLAAPVGHNTRKARAYCESLRSMFYAPEKTREDWLARHCGDFPAEMLPTAARAACFVHHA